MAMRLPVTLSVLALAAVCAAGSAQAVRLPPEPPSCRLMIAQHDGRQGLWRGQFAGSFDGGPFYDTPDFYSRVGCFPSEAACRRWIYDVRSAINFLNEVIVECRPLAG